MKRRKILYRWIFYGTLSLITKEGITKYNTMTDKTTKKSIFKYIGSVFLIVLALFLLWAGSTFITFNESVPTFRQEIDLSLTDDNNYLSEDCYTELMDSMVEPILTTYRQSGTFLATDHVELYYEKFIVPNSKGTIVISHGFTENIQKFKETIYYYVQNGFSVFALDHRGHGYSYRNVEDLSLVHTEDFTQYINDFTTFIFDVVDKQADQATPKFLYAHSMGGAIGAGFLSNYPDYFTSAVLTAPMLQVNTGVISEKLSQFIAKVYTFIGKEEAYILGQSPFTGENNIESSSTASKARYDYFLDVTTTDTLLQTSAGSFNWLYEAIGITNTLTSKDVASKITTPILLFEAGNDTTVKPYGLYEFAKNVPNLDMIVVPGAKHSLFAETNELLIPYFNTIFNFFNGFLE